MSLRIYRSFHIFLPKNASLRWLNNASCSFLSYLLPVRCYSNLRLPASYVHCTVKQVYTVWLFQRLNCGSQFPLRCRQSSLVTDKQAKTGCLVAGALQSLIGLTWDSCKYQPVYRQLNTRLLTVCRPYDNL
jgi:hypothetical protein